jgi:hypothetical protein
MDDKDIVVARAKRQVRLAILAASVAVGVMALGISQLSWARGAGEFWRERYRQELSARRNYCWSEFQQCVESREPHESTYRFCADKRMSCMESQ